MIYTLYFPQLRPLCQARPECRCGPKSTVQKLARIFIYIACQISNYYTYMTSGVRGAAGRRVTRSYGRGVNSPPKHLDMFLGVRVNP